MNKRLRNNIVSCFDSIPETGGCPIKNIEKIKYVWNSNPDIFLITQYKDEFRLIVTDISVIAMPVLKLTLRSEDAVRLIAELELVKKQVKPFNNGFIYRFSMFKKIEKALQDAYDLSGKIELDGNTGSYYYNQMVEHIQRAQAKLLALKNQLEGEAQDE